MNTSVLDSFSGFSHQRHELNAGGEKVLGEVNKEEMKMLPIYSNNQRSLVAPCLVWTDSNMLFTVF